MGLERRVQMIKHHTGLDGHSALVHIERQDVAHVLAVINHQACTHRLAALAGATATRHDGHIQITADVQRQLHVLRLGGHKHPHRHLLVDGCVGGIAATISCAE